MEYVIKTKTLTKKYGEKTAVNGMSLHVKQGDMDGERRVGRNLFNRRIRMNGFENQFVSMHGEHAQRRHDLAHISLGGNEVHLL